MVEKISVAQAGALGGKKKWAKISKEKRSAMMKKVAEARWNRRKQITK